MANNIRNDNKERYGKVDLKYFREHMSLELFQAFVKHIGSIRGKVDLDISSFVDYPYKEFNG